MKVALDRLILYSHDNASRVVDFHDDRLNIITGDSKTGKSAIIHIVDYCLGSNDCHVPDGVIRRKVAWYAVVLKKGSERLLLARANPPKGAGTSSFIHVRPLKDRELPSCDGFTKNMDIDGLKELLTRFVGIEENLHVPSENSTRPLLRTSRTRASSVSKTKV